MSEGPGVPLAIMVAGADVHGTRLIPTTRDAVAIERPEREQHLCLDAGYIGEKTANVDADFANTAHRRPLGEDTVHARDTDPRRWVVERLHSWHKRIARPTVIRPDVNGD